MVSHGWCHGERGAIVVSIVDTNERIAAAWRDDRRYVEAVAARILSDPAEAEDTVQDAFARLTVQRVDEIDDLRGWLVVVVRRLALDRLGSAHRRLSTPHDPGTLPPEPAAGPTTDPADRVTLDDEVRRALSVVLDQLSPPERAAFLLHDVFGIPYARVAEVVGRSPAACRQLASRARRSVRGSGPTRSHPAPDPALREVAERFADACAGGDVEGLVRLLHPRAEGWATVDGTQVGYGAGVEALATGTLSYLGPRSGWSVTPLLLGDGVALLATRAGEPVVVVRLDVRDALVEAIHAVVLPAAALVGGAPT